MSIKFNVQMEDKDVLDLQRTMIECSTYKDTLSQALTTGGLIAPEAFEYYHDKQVKAEIDYAQLKDMVERKYMPDYLYGQHQYAWNINFTKHLFEVDVQCECGCTLVKDDPAIEWFESGSSSNIHNIAGQEAHYLQVMGS